MLVVGTPCAHSSCGRRNWRRGQRQEGSVTATTKAAAGECSVVTVERRLAAVIRGLVPLPAIPRPERTLRAKLDAAIATLALGPLGNAFPRWNPRVAGGLDLRHA